MNARIPIVFRCPDVAEPSDIPRLMLRHHQILEANGWKTYVVSSSTSGLSRWVERATEILCEEPSGPCMRVVAESDEEQLLRPGRKVVLADSVDPDVAWAENAVEAVIATNPQIKGVVEAYSGMPVTVISPSVDRRVFSPKSKVRAIAYGPNRDNSHVTRIFDLCPPCGFVRVPIEELPITKVGEILSHAAIFLATGPRGDFGLSALEAMASGCIVVGYATEGGWDYMEDGVNCLLVPDGDCESAAQMVAVAARLFDEGKAEDLTRQAIGTAQRFSPGREAADVIRFWNAIAEAPRRRQEIAREHF